MRAGVCMCRDRKDEGEDPTLGSSNLSTWRNPHLSRRAQLPLGRSDPRWETRLQEPRIEGSHTRGEGPFPHSLHRQGGTFLGGGRG